MHVIGVAKAYRHAGRRIRHRSSTRKAWKVYYYDDSLKFQARWINALDAARYRLQVKSRKTMRCYSCGARFKDYQWDHEKCPYCGL